MPDHKRDCRPLLLGQCEELRRKLAHHVAVERRVVRDPEAVKTSGGDGSSTTGDTPSTHPIPNRDLNGAADLCRFGLDARGRGGLGTLN